MNEPERAKQVRTVEEFKRYVNEPFENAIKRYVFMGNIGKRLAEQATRDQLVQIIGESELSQNVSPLTKFNWIWTLDKGLFYKHPAHEITYVAHHDFASHGACLDKIFKMRDEGISLEEAERELTRYWFIESKETEAVYRDLVECLRAAYKKPKEEWDDRKQREYVDRYCTTMEGFLKDILLLNGKSLFSTVFR